MKVELIVRIDGREVAAFAEHVETKESLPLEEHVERLKDRAGRAILEVGFGESAGQLRHPCCCGRQMENKGKRLVTIASQSGDVTFERHRYRCRVCHRWLMPADAVVCCGRHRMTRLLSRNVCQLATLEHFTRLEQLLADQHGVHLSRDAMLHLVHDVGGAVEQQRLAEVEHWQSQPAKGRTWPEPDPGIVGATPPRKLYVSCDGIMYCTLEVEPDPLHPGENRLIWKQMRVGCVYWQDEQEHWHKRVIWGQEEDFLSFGASLFRLACQCGYQQAQEQVFAADGADWCWTIHQHYFAQAQGILDWYHANEHIWQCGPKLHSDGAEAKNWSTAAESLLYEQGGTALLDWLVGQRPSCRGAKRRALDGLINYLQPKLDRTAYPSYRNKNWQIGTGMIESTAKQLVGLRIKGPGMHWCKHGATAITALRAQDLNNNWHRLWKNLTLTT